MAHITLTQLNTILNRIVIWVTGKFAAKNATSGKLEYADMPVVVLASMGSELDGVSRPMSAGDTYFLPAAEGAAARIMYRPDSGNPVKISDPVSNVIYCNAYTGLLYRWDASQAKMIPVGGDGDGLRKVYVGNNDFSSLDTLYSGVYQVIDQTTQRIIGVLVALSDNKYGADPYSVTQWLFSNLELSDEYSGSFTNYYTDGRAHIIHRFYNASNSTSHIPLNTWSEWKVYGLTLDEISENLNSKVSSISVNGQTPQTPVNGNVDIDAVTQQQMQAAITDALDNLPTGSVESVTVNGTKHTPDANGDVDLGTIVGQKGDKGDTGNCTITDAGQMVSEIVNDLTTGGADKFLSAEMGKKLKSKIEDVQNNIENLYNKLANMAFWNAADKAAAAPTPLDWSVPKVAVTITNNIGSGAVIKRNGQTVTSPLQADQGDSLTLTIEAAPNNVLSNVAATVDGVSVSLTESGGVYTLVIAHVNAATTIVISGTATAAFSITYNLTGCHKVSGPTSVLNGGSATIVLAADTEYSLPSTLPSGAVTGAIVTDWDSSTGELEIGSVNGNVTIAVTATSEWETVPKDDVLDGNNNVITYGIQQGRSIMANNGVATNGTGNGAPNIVMMPCSEPSGADKRIITSIGQVGDNTPGYSTAYFFATGGKKYLHVKVDGEINSGCYLKVAIGCYKSSIVDGQATTTSGVQSRAITRISYITANNGTQQWKFDLHTAATTNPTVSGSYAAGDIAYVKFLICEYLDNTNTGQDSRNWIDNVTIKYKFTDD